MADDFVAHDCGWTGTLQAFVDARREKLCPVNNTACDPQVCAPVLWARTCNYKHSGIMPMSRVLRDLGIEKTD
jgi:hypothetical protein